MKLGAALAVVRYNDGYAGIKEVFELLEQHLGPIYRSLPTRLTRLGLFEVNVL